MIYIVSGLPRSGTSMMMKMLEAGGLPVLIDKENPSTELNPGGAYAYEPTKRMGEDVSWLIKAEGKAVKVLAWFVHKLPADHGYKIIFMERTPAEVTISLGKLAADRGNESSLPENILIQQSKTAKDYLSKHDNMTVLLVDYNKMVFDPVDTCKSIAEFIELPLNVKAMVKIVNSDLYRIRV